MLKEFPFDSPHGVGDLVSIHVKVQLGEAGNVCVDSAHRFTYHRPCASFLRPFDSIDILSVYSGDIFWFCFGQDITNEEIVEFGWVVGGVNAVVVVVVVL